MFGADRLHNKLDKVLEELYEIKIETIGLQKDIGSNREAILKLGQRLDATEIKIDDIDTNSCNLDMFNKLSERVQKIEDSGKKTIGEHIMHYSKLLIAFMIILGASMAVNKAFFKVDPLSPKNISPKIIKPIK